MALHRIAANAAGTAVIEELVCLTVPLRPPAAEIVDKIVKIKVLDCTIDNGFAIVDARVTVNVLFKTVVDDCGKAQCGEVRHCSASAEICAAAPIDGVDGALECKVKEAKVVAQAEIPVDENDDGRFEKVRVKLVIRIKVAAVDVEC